MRRSSWKQNFNSTELPAIVLEGLHFDVLLGMSWLEAVKAKLDIEKGSIEIGGRITLLKSYPNSTALSAKTKEESKKVYSVKGYELWPGETQTLEVKHNCLADGIQCYFHSRMDCKVKFPVIVTANADGFISKIIVECQGEGPVAIQKGQHLGELMTVTEANLNKDNSSYFCASSININKAIEHLEGEDYQKWYNLLGKWSVVISKNNYNVGLTDIQYTIKVKEYKPVKGYIPRRTPAMVQAINEELAKLEAAGFVEPSISPFASPTVCVQKKDKSLRVCIDFRMVNKDIINDAYPLHRIDDQLEAMAGARFFTTMDLTKGYHQMQLDPASKEFTAFTTPKGLYQWTVLPMGMKTSGAVFQRLMDNILGELQPKCAVVYIDDVTIFSATMEDHIRDVGNVLEQLALANLKVNLKKCKFARREVLVLRTFSE